MKNVKLIQKLIIMLGFFSLLYLQLTIEFIFDPLNELSKDSLIVIGTLVSAFLISEIFFWDLRRGRKIRFFFLQVDWKDWDNSSRQKFIAYFGTIYLALALIITSIVISLDSYLNSTDKFLFEANLLDVFFIIFIVTLFYYEAFKLWKYNRKPD